MQNEIKKQSGLLNTDGSLIQKGWSVIPLLKYDRKAIKASGLRIKEWDYYCVLNSDYGIGLTAADLGYLGMASIVWMDFRGKHYVTKDLLTLLPMGRWELPSDSDKGGFLLEKKSLSLGFGKSGNYRILSFNSPKFLNGKGIQGKLSLYQDPEHDSITIATPFAENPRAFYYNRKINCMPAQGEVKIGEDIFSFKPDSDFGVLDWGRGVWTYSNTWYWGSASGMLKGRLFGFNIGYGFGDTSAATENIVYYDKKGHKLDTINFHIPEDSFMKQWTFSSNDCRFEMSFIPVLDRSSSIDFKLLRSNQNQVFGFFSGSVILDNAKKLTIKNLFGFAEKVVNRW